MKSRNLFFIGLAVIIVIGLTMVGCSNRGGDLLQQVSGKWQDNQNKSKVEINLAGKDKTVTVDGQAYPVTVENVETLNYIVNLKVQNGGAQPDTWALRQIWNENGSDFKLAFNHDGEKEVLVHAQQS